MTSEHQIWKSKFFLELFYSARHFQLNMRLKLLKIVPEMVTKKSQHKQTCGLQMASFVI